VSDLLNLTRYERRRLRKAVEAPSTSALFVKPESLSPGDYECFHRQGGPFLGRSNLIEGTVAAQRSHGIPPAHLPLRQGHQRWIASSPGGIVQKYTHDGSKLLQQIGKKGAFDTSDGTARAPR
jgi:hypothetical protein